jgi:ribonuclease R
VTKRSKPRKGKIVDPNYEREARKYDNPIPSREFIIDLINDAGCPMAFKEIAAALKIEEEQIEALSRRVKAMARDAQLVRNRKGGYCVVNKQDLIAGRVIGHPDGFGFLKPDEGGDDLFLGPREMRKVWHGDHVVAQVSGMDRRGRYEGVIIEVVERAYASLVGRLHIEHGVATLMPDNKRIAHQVLIEPDHLGDAKDGQIVVAAIDEHPTEWRQPIGRITEVLGDHMAPGMETDVAIRAHNIPVDWPETVLEQIKAFGEEVPEEAKEGRVDLRKLPFVTIDGADSRDFDDAVFCAKTPKGWKLLVAIADVSAYVKPGTPLDDEAYHRATSVYFPDRVVPMLPEVLSNGLCSINPHVDRLCMVAEMYFDGAGKIYRSRFFEGLMNSHARLTYDQVGAMLLDGDAELCEQFAGVLPHLHELYGLYNALHGARAVRGAIDFDTVETKFKFDDNGKVAEVVPVVRHDAHRIIEECMLAANVAAAKLLLRKKIPALYRIHERPSVEKLTDLGQFLSELGLSLGGGTAPTAKDYADLLEKVKERADFHVIQTVLLRSMMQAVYSHDNVGHFGLAFDAYAHFTSPIRRYPDLMVHRAIRHLLLGGTGKNFEYDAPHLAAMGEHCSTLERRADEASRDSTDALKCEFMLDKVGGDFPGVIASVNSFGLFVELEEIYITGLVHITALDKDYFHFDPVGHRLTGERTGRVYRLGDSLRVRVAAVNMDDRKIDFVLPDTGSSDSDSGSRRQKGRKSDNKADRKRGGRKVHVETASTKQEADEKPKRKPKAKSARTRKTRETPALLVVPEGEAFDAPRAEPPKAKRKRRSRKKS